MAVTDMTFNEAVRAAAIAYLLGGGGGGGGGGAITVADGADIALGSTTDPAWDGSEPEATIASIVRAIYGEQALADLKFGALTDAAWDGSGDPDSFIALVRGLVSDALNDDPVLVTPSSAEYEPVAASQTDQMGGSTGAIGDTIEGVLIIPTTTSPGAVSIEDGSTNTVIFDGGANSVGDLKPFYVPLMNIASVSGGWEVTTGANVRAIVFGNFT